MVLLNFTKFIKLSKMEFALLRWYLVIAEWLEVATRRVVVVIDVAVQARGGHWRWHWGWR